MSPQQRWNPASLRLIAITDSLRDGVEGLAARAFSAVHGGATLVHLRLSEETPRVICDAAHAIRALMPSVPLIVNARFDIALAVGADGVHLGVDDLAPAAVRRVVPPGFVIGVSVGNQHEAERALQADFVGIGPVFSRGDVEGALGPQGFGALARQCARPAVAIGGIDANNVADVMAAGAAGIAVISALFGSADPAAAARALRLAQDASGM